MERGAEESAPMWREGTFHNACKLKLGKKQDKSMSFYLLFLVYVNNKEIQKGEVVEVAWLKQDHVLDEVEMSRSKNPDLSLTEVVWVIRTNMTSFAELKYSFAQKVNMSAKLILVSTASGVLFSSHCTF